MMRRLLLVGVLVLAFVGGAGDAHAATTRRLAGNDRYDTAARVALDRWTSPSDVILASGTDPADALAGAFVSGLHSSPVFLTTRDALPAPTLAALRQIGPRTVHVLGGTASIGGGVVAALEAEGWAVRRHAGADRFGTAAAAARSEGGALIGAWRSEGSTAIVANGRRPFDALAAGPLAAGQLFPILLTETDTVPAATSAALDDLGIEHVLVMGGTAVVSDAAIAALEASGRRTVRRVAGLDRSGTATAVADLLLELDYDITRASLVSATTFADALGAGPWGAPSSPVLLCDSPSFCGPNTTQWVRVHPLEELVVVGGEAAVSDAAASMLVAPA
jgi:putative cell wall-binding protein